MIDFQPYKQFLVKPLKDRFSLLRLLKIPSLAPKFTNHLKGTQGSLRRPKKKKTEKKQKQDVYLNRVRNPDL